MSVLCISDLHVSKDPIRIVTVLNYLDYIINYCKEHKEIKSVINLGDTFDHPQQKSNVLLPIFRKMRELSDVVNGNLFTILGNHDLIQKDGSDTLAETFSSFGKFIQNSETLEVPGLGIADFMSFTDNITAIPNKSRILFGHLEIEGFYFNPNKKIDGTMFTTSLFDNYNLVVSGHLHHEQHKNNFEFVGTAYPTNRGEGNKNNYFAVISDTYQVELVEYNDGPDYLTIKAEEFNENINYTNKIIDVEISRKVENFVKLRDILMDRGAIQINPIFIKEEVNDFSNRQININEGVVKSACKYLQETEADGIDNNILLQCFKEILKRSV